MRGKNDLSTYAFRRTSAPGLSTFAALVLVLVAGVGCPTRGAPDEGQNDAGGVGDAMMPDEPMMTRPKLPAPEHKALGAACSAAGDCSSGFCIDGVCCDTACGATCFACNVAGSAGTCSALRDVEDATATPPCAGSSICSLDSAGVTACRLKDGEPCAVAADCATGYCGAYYRDVDGDHYGSDSADTIHRCDAVDRPPQGFSVTAGDCCEADPDVHPGVSEYFTVRNACGTFDWNCSGAEEKQTGASCPAAAGGVLACGQACTVVLKGASDVLFVQACH